jgi:hypothetical protein
LVSGWIMGDSKGRCEEKGREKKGLVHCDRLTDEDLTVSGSCFDGWWL